MGFSEFYGNTDVIHRLRDMLARNRFPPCRDSGWSGRFREIYAFPDAGKGKNCLSPILTDNLPDFCGQCSNCVRIAQAEDFEARFTEAVEAREGLRETDKKETRLFVQTHPDVLVIPPDPPQMMIKVDQVRRCDRDHLLPSWRGQERVYIFTDSAFMKEAANSLLQSAGRAAGVPPRFSCWRITPVALLPTIRSAFDDLLAGGAVHAGGRAVSGSTSS